LGRGGVGGGIQSVQGWWRWWVPLLRLKWGGGHGDDGKAGGIWEEGNFAAEGIGER
jgi:hypothetical protein